MPRRFLKLALAASALPLLSGCVAALVPLAASSALLGNEALDNDDSGDAVAEVTVREAISDLEVAEFTAPPPEPPAELPAELPPELAASAPAQDLAAQSASVALAAHETGETSAATLIGPVDEGQGQRLFAAPTVPAQAPPELRAKTTAETFAETFAETTISNEQPDAAAIVPAPPPPPAAARASLAAPPFTAEPPQAAAPAPTVELPPSPSEADAIFPAPAKAATIPAVPFGPTDFRAYDVMYKYVDIQSRRDPVDLPRQSAILAAPGSLSPLRTDCSIRPPAVVVDLDPGTDIFDPAIVPAPNPALSQMLASLRLQEVEVFWISELAAVKAGEVRRSLVESGMDAQGRDQLLLMRRVGDRKQTRRRELSETHCLIAIAGDNRGDFDELFLYLRDKSAAQPLEELIGAGWFLTPLPLNASTAIER